MFIGDAIMARFDDEHTDKLLDAIVMMRADGVNVASRVEGLTKERGVGVLVTDAVVARLRDPARFPLRKVAEGVVLRGRVDPVDLYTLEEPGLS